jgi:hypothetical protein
MRRAHSGSTDHTGLENRYGRIRPSGVRIPPSPLNTGLFWLHAGISEAGLAVESQAHLPLKTAGNRYWGHRTVTGLSPLAGGASAVELKKHHQARRPSL